MHKKCDRRLPSCDRCFSRGIPCIYTEKQKKGRPRKYIVETQFVKDKIEKPHKMKNALDCKREHYEEKEPDQPPENLFLLSSIVG